MFLQRSTQINRVISCQGSVHLHKDQGRAAVRDSGWAREHSRVGNLDSSRPSSRPPSGPLERRPWTLVRSGIGPPRASKPGLAAASRLWHGLISRAEGPEDKAQIRSTLSRPT
jgi:hypothetical protein